MHFPETFKVAKREKPMTRWGESAKLGKQTAEQTLTPENISLPGCQLTQIMCSGVPQLMRICKGLSGAPFSTSHSDQGFLVITAVHAPASNLHSPLEYENRLLNSVNYVSVCDLYPLLPWPLSLKPYLCSAPSYLLHLATWWYVMLRTSLGYASGCHHMPQAGVTSVCQMPCANWLKYAQIISGKKAS